MYVPTMSILSNYVKINIFSLSIHKESGKDLVHFNVKLDSIVFYENTQHYK